MTRLVGRVCVPEPSLTILAIDSDWSEEGDDVAQAVVMYDYEAKTDEVWSHLRCASHSMQL